VHGYSLLRPQINKDYFHELYDAAETFGIEIEGHHTETGPGVFETVSLSPTVCPFTCYSKGR
jgi:glutamine synthetase